MSRFVIASLLTTALLCGCATPPVPEPSPRARAEQLAELGLRRLRAGDVAGARRAYNTASAIDPFFVRAHLGLARCFYVVGELELEVAEYRKALALSPKLVTVWANVGHALFAQDQLADAREAYIHVVDLGRRDLVAWQLALVERDLGVAAYRGREPREPLEIAAPETADAIPELPAPTEVR